MGKKKTAWRKIDVQQEVDAVGDDALRDRVEREVNLFSVDTKGRAGRADQKRKADAVWNVSVGERTRLKKAANSLYNKGDEKKSNAGRVYDLWGDNVASQPKDAASVEGKTISSWAGRTLAPGVKLPHPGQSVNPEMHSHLALLESEAARVIEQNREIAAVSAKDAPVTAQLAEMIPEEELSKMTFGEKRQALNNLFVLSKPHTHAVDVNDDCNTNNNADDELIDDGVGGSITLPKTSTKQPRKKSKGKRNKEARHAARVQMTNAKRTERLFVHSIQNAGSILKELRKRDLNVIKRTQYMRAYRARLKEEEAKGDVSFKTGRNPFGEGPEGVPLTADIAMSSGSLRATRIPVGASTLMDRVKSAERRGLVELPAMGDELAHQRTRQMMLRRKALKSRKYINTMMRGAEKKTRKRVLQSNAGLKMVNKSRRKQLRKNAAATGGGGGTMEVG
eukprot:Lankesteria_metandrocarpae@DN3439_c0_g1_i1.p1